MKKRHFLMAGLAAMFMASCSDNELTQDNGPQIAEKGGKVYMKVNIANPTNGSRALSDDPKFDNGTDEESAVKKILFAFYNQAGNYVGQSTMTWSESPSGDLEFGGTVPNQGDGSNVETKLTMVVPVDVNAGGYLPYYVVAYVNPAASDQAKAKSLDEISSLERGNDQYCDASGNFVMNNSTYYAGKDTSKPVFATQIKKLAETKHEAQNTAATDIYVERICAKVTVNKNADGLDMNDGTEIKDAISDTDTKISFHPAAWALNATAKHTYLVKQFRKEKESAPVSYSEVEERFKALTPEWNDAINKRSYWCTGYAYAFDNYPKVASQAEGADIPVHYNSYTDIKNNGFAWGASTYCLEHTVTNAGAPLAAYTSVIVVGYYTLGDNETATTFYTYGAVDKKPVVYSEMDKLVNAMADASNPVCSDNTGTAVEADALSDIYEVKRPNATVIGGILVPSRYVYLQVKDAVATGDTPYYFRTAEGEYQQITADNINDVNRMLMSSNPATMYNAGMAYYNIPIEQFGLGAESKVAYGSYGVVRNHSYNINIKGISGLGTGIADPTDPIIPPTEEQTYYVNTELNVLAWRVMASQDVTLGE